MSEEKEEFILRDGSASLEYQTPFQSRMVNLKGVKIRQIERGGRDWMEASSDSSWHLGYGSSPEAAILSLLAHVIGLDSEDIG
jgi:hypothetical protein